MEDISKLSNGQLRNLLADASVEWKKRFLVAPNVGKAVTNFDAARLVHIDLEVGKGRRCQDKQLSKKCSFVKDGKRYIVRYSKPFKTDPMLKGVNKIIGFDWDYLIWVLIDPFYSIQEAWMFEVKEYKEKFEYKNDLKIYDMRKGTRIR